MNVLSVLVTAVRLPVAPCRARWLRAILSGSPNTLEWTSLQTSSIKTSSPLMDSSPLKGGDQLKFQRLFQLRNRTESASSSPVQEAAPSMLYLLLVAHTLACVPTLRKMQSWPLSLRRARILSMSALGAICIKGDCRHLQLPNGRKNFTTA